eukprot:m.201558 g.201558  ORF g.201558 m.201558 type:complete len:491 (+) comp21462_c0_seq1:341-1813(+)
MHSSASMASTGSSTRTTSTSTASTLASRSRSVSRRQTPQAHTVSRHPTHRVRKEATIPTTEKARMAAGLDYTDTSHRPKLRHLPMNFVGEWSSDAGTQTNLSETASINQIVREHRALKEVLDDARREIKMIATVHAATHAQQVRHAERTVVSEMERLIAAERVRTASAVEATLRSARAEAENDKEQLKASRKADEAQKIAALEAKHAAEVAILVKRASNLATQVLNLERALQALKDKHAKEAKGKGAGSDKATDITLDEQERDYDDLEDVTSMRLKMQQAESQVAHLTAELRQANEAAQRAEQRAKLLLASAKQEAAQHARVQRTQKIELDRLAGEVNRLETQLFSGTIDVNAVKADVTRKVKMQMTELSAAEAKRQAVREKRRLQELHSRHEMAMAAQEKKLCGEIEKVKSDFQGKIEGLQKRHASELAAVDKRWKKKFEVIEEATIDLSEPAAYSQILAAQARIQEHAAGRFSLEVDNVDSFLPPLNN